MAKAEWITFKDYRMKFATEQKYLFQERFPKWFMRSKCRFQQSSSITISGHPILTNAGTIAVRLLLPHAPPIENMIRWRVILLPNVTVIEPIPVRKKSRQVHRNMLPVKDSKRSRSGSTTVVIAKIKLAWMNFVSASSEGLSSLAFSRLARTAAILCSLSILCSENFV